MFARVLIIVLLAAVVWAVVARAGTAAGPERAYTVRAGDTLWSIAAARYAGDTRSAVWEISRRNGLQGGTIRAGQRLVLP